MHEHKCCCSNHEHPRKYLTKTEQLEQLKKYEQDLTKELQAVQEKIKEASA
jgi:hypothetical protein